MLLLRKFFSWMAPYDCQVCGREGDWLCSGCLSSLSPARGRSPPAPLSGLWIGGDYDGLIRQALHAYKFERAQDLAAALAWLLDRAAPTLPGDTVVTYVPTASNRIRARGYDHAESLARAFGERRKLVVKSLLVRHGQSRQVGADRTRRLRQMGVYSLKPGSLPVAGTPIVLIDDIMTTGATLKAAAEVLVAAGAGRVDGLVVAHKK